MANHDPDPWSDHPPIVSDDFDVPTGLTSECFRLAPLGVAHNAADYSAWTSSIDHIRATPGFAGRDWPDPAMTLTDNESDLAGHAGHFAKRIGFTYTVLDADSDEVIGCVYLYPPGDADHDVDVRSWVRADRADLDRTVYEEVLRWLAEEWPFTAPAYAPRDQ